MKKSNKNRLQTIGLCFLILLINHECIAITNQIKHGVMMQKHVRMQDDMFHNLMSTDNLENIVRTLEKNVDIVDDNDLSFLEMQDMQGMSTEEYATHEIKEMHKSLKESFTFDQSPILNEVGNLKEVLWCFIRNR